MKRIIYLISGILLLAGCSGREEKVEPQYEELDAFAIAVQSVINMREDPDYAAELGTQALMGTPLKLHHKGANGYWSMVETPDGYKAWCNEMAVRQITTEELAEWKASKRMIVTAYYTFFLDAPSADAQHVSDGCWGCIVQYKGEENGFTKVVLPGGQEAYVPSADVEDLEKWAKGRKAVVPADASQEQVEVARQAILETARKFVGIPYLWAGTSIKGVDCSGFSKTVYYMNGYYLLRNASQQYKTGDPIDVSEGLDNLQPADLLFFGREATAEKPEKITHVAIYLGDGKIIHSSQIVRINSLIEGEPDYYSRKPIRACRIIGTQDCGKGVLSITEGGIFFN